MNNPLETILDLGRTHQLKAPTRYKNRNEYYSTYILLACIIISYVATPRTASTPRIHPIALCSTQKVILRLCNSCQNQKRSHKFPSITISRVTLCTGLFARRNHRCHELHNCDDEGSATSMGEETPSRKLKRSERSAAHLLWIGHQVYGLLFRRTSCCWRISLAKRN